MQDIMLDLETMGTGPAAAIVAIGAVEFDLGTRQLGRRFYQVVDLKSSVLEGGILDADTVCWWMKQSDAARAVFSAPAQHIMQALRMFGEFAGECCGAGDLNIWGNGAAFDNVVLASAFDRSGIQRPWAYQNDRCYRTVKALHPEVSWERVGTAHNALDDAISQAQHLVAMMGPHK